MQSAEHRGEGPFAQLERVPAPPLNVEVFESESAAGH